MGKLDINTLLSSSINKSTAVTENADLNVNLEGVDNTETKTEENKFNLNLESVAIEEKIQNYLGEGTISNLRAAIASGMAVSAVLEARTAARQSTT
jgi:hypothetical protein